MADREELLRLAERCGAASAAEQRKMLEATYAVVFGGPECIPIARWPGYSSPNWDRFYGMLNVEAYESAAMLLVPEGMQFGAGRDNIVPGPEGWAWVSGDDDTQIVRAVTPALALAAASSRARAQEEHRA